VTGPRGAGKTRWIQSRILECLGQEPGGQCGVVRAEDGHTRMEHFAHEVPDVAVRRVRLPCPCCPARACLLDTVRELVRATTAAWIWVEASATAAAGLLRVFDRELGWAINWSCASTPNGSCCATAPISRRFSPRSSNRPTPSSRPARPRCHRRPPPFNST
jgi:hypothetical protein